MGGGARLRQKRSSESKTTPAGLVEAPAQWQAIARASYVSRNQNDKVGRPGGLDNNAVAHEAAVKGASNANGKSHAQPGGARKDLARPAVGCRACGLADGVRSARGVCRPR
ncbi:hypothetical protein SAMD00023378_2080 [Ralstonia sp. NT80]|nr:hypothetical protein SAMD00023378_2080 [Ralstonia sp. NT80]